jgi:predicted dehydrogenase
VAEAARVRVGFIGGGRIVERAHLAVLSRVGTADVVGVYDPNRARAEELARALAIAPCRSPEELWSRRPDLVVVACPNAEHAAMSVAAMRAGAHVLCEKPMAVRTSEAERMRAAAGETGRRLFVGFPNRHRPEISALERLVAQGALGEVLSIRCGWMRRAGIPGTGTWFAHRSSSGGGALIDLGSHVMHVALRLGGARQPRRALCVLRHSAGTGEDASWYAKSRDVRSGRCDVETSASGAIVFENGVDVTLDVGWVSAEPYDRTWFRVLGSRGVAHVETLFGFSPYGNPASRPLRAWVDGSELELAVASSEDLLQPFEAQIRHVLGELSPGRDGKRGPDADVDCAVAVVRSIDALYASDAAAAAVAAAAAGRS